MAKIESVNQMMGRQVVTQLMPAVFIACAAAEYFFPGDQFGSLTRSVVALVRETPQSAQYVQQAFHSVGTRFQEGSLLDWADMIRSVIGR